MTSQQRQQLTREQARYETRARHDQTLREAQADGTALEMWAVLFLGGEYQRAARHWREVVHPTLTKGN